MGETTQQKCDIIAPFIDAHNKVLGESYTIDEGDSYLVIRPTEGNHSISGCLVKKISLLAEAYNWSFGIHKDNNGIYILI